MDEVEAFNTALDPTQKRICDALRAQFDQRLGPGTARLFHGAPVWFADENPLVGYSVKKAGIAVLFWSGQSFQEPGLTPLGKHKAAELLLREGEAIPGETLDLWLAEARVTVWDYKNIAKRNGVLELLKN